MEDVTKVDGFTECKKEEGTSRPSIKVENEGQCADITEFVAALHHVTVKHANEHTVEALTTAVRREKKKEKKNKTY